MDDLSKEVMQDESLKENSSDKNDSKNSELSMLLSCQQELADSKSRYLYLHAEFDNYKKRVVKDRALWTETAQDQAILDILALYDNMERAFAELRTQALPDQAQAHFKGFELIMKSFEALIKKYGIEEIIPHKIFHPTVAEAVMQQESVEHQSGEIVAVLQKGYRRNGRVIRTAQVSVAR